MLGRHTVQQIPNKLTYKGRGAYYIENLLIPQQKIRLNDSVVIPLAVNFNQGLPR